MALDDQELILEACRGNMLVLSGLSFTPLTPDGRKEYDLK